MALSDTQIRNTKPAEKPWKLFDEKGLYLLINPNGGRWWRFKYRVGGKEKLLSLGIYPDVGLKEARKRRDEAREVVAAGGDPGENRKQEKAAEVEKAENSFEAVAREWHQKKSPKWSATHALHLLQRLERDVFPYLGVRPVKAIAAPEILKLLRMVEDRGFIETASQLAPLSP